MYRLAPPATAGAAIKVGAAVAIGGASLLVRGLVDIRVALAHVPSAFWVLAVLAVVADALPFAVPGAARRARPVFVSVCFTFAIMLLWGAGPAVAVQAVSVTVAGIRQQLGVARTLFTMGRLSAALVAADAVLSASGTPAFTIGEPLGRADVIAVAVAGLVWFVVNYLLVIVKLRVLQGATWRQILTRTFPHELLSAAALLSLAALLVSASTDWVIALILVPVIAVSQVVRLSEGQDRLVRFDQLTGLLSRRALAEEVADLTSRFDRRGREESPADTRYALLLIDLDRFKTVNDALGHAVGDRLLAEVARRLERLVRPGDAVARLGGDEFAVIAKRVGTLEHARAIAGRIEADLRQPVYLDGLPLDVSASIGIAVCPLHGSDFVTLLRHADVAMYSAKHREATVAVYSPQADQNSVARLNLLADLRRALEDPDRAHEITLEYQPQVVIATGEVVGVEALLRWQHPDQGSVRADETVHIAEHSAVMQSLTHRVIDEAVAQLAAWRAAGIVLRVSINVSVRDLHTTTIVDHLRDCLRREQVPGQQVELEVTETGVMTDTRAVVGTLQQLAQLGVGISLDDFGTGYSPLLHLRRLPLSEVKIDHSFVKTMATNSDDEAVVRSIIGLTHALGLRVVAEGVEDSTVAGLLVEADCDVAQGWHYGRPMRPNDVSAWLARRATTSAQPAPPVAYRNASPDDDHGH